MSAQAQLRVRRADDPGRAEIQGSAPIDDLFERAADGASRQDWKFTVDSLQRIIDDPQGALHSDDEIIYESARRLAYRRLGTLPEAALRTYHLVYDTSAQAQYDRALQAHDAVALRRVVDRYLLTPAGEQAATVLASWLIDGGLPSEALGVLETLQSLNPRSAALTLEVPARVALASAMLGRSELAGATIARLQAMPDLDPTWSERLSRIEDYIATDPVTGSGPTDQWTMMYGGPLRNGHMPGASPAFLEGLPWRYDLPLKLVAPWARLVDQHAIHPLLLTSQMLASDEALFVKAGDDVVALDLISLDERWRSNSPPRPPRPQPSIVINPGRALTASTDDRTLARVLSDQLGADISLAHGMIFNLEAVEVQTGRRRVVRGQLPAKGPTRLVARDQDSGRIRWTVGGIPDQSGSFAGAIFAAAPIESGDNLFVPYWVDKDIFAGLLDPSDGRMIARAHLCTLPSRPDTWHYPLLPAIDGTVAYMPTNGGLLLAVDTSAPVLKWAARYERGRYTEMQPDTLWAGIERQANNIRASVQWLPGPPVIAGGLVVLAPPDANHLVAFDRNSGKPAWVRARGAHRYVIASDARHLWLGGPHVSRIDAHTGDALWVTEVGPSTGRAVLSGDHIFVPTASALVALDGQNGDLLPSQEYPVDATPLGNVLCWGGAMFAIDSEQVRKFPDLEQSYAAAKTEYADHPTDAMVCLRLAWMELIREDPHRVLDVLAPWDPPRDDRLGAQMAHLKTTAYLTLAMQQPADRERLLRLALRIARTAQDRYDAGIALADAVAADGRLEQAYKDLFDLRRSLASGEMVEAGSGVQRSTRALLAKRLAALRTVMSSESSATLVKTLRPDVLDAGLENKRNTAARSALDDLVASDTLGGWPQRAALQLGRWDVLLRKFERAEYYLSKALHGESDLAVDALERLARMYLRLELFHLAEPTVNRLESLARRTRSTGKSDIESLREEAAAGKAKLRKKFRDTHDSGGAWKGMSLLSGNIVHFDHAGQGCHPEVAIMWENPNILAAYRTTDGSRLWDAPLRFLNADDPGTTTSSVSRVPCGARIDGQTLLVNTREGVHAVGLATGRRLWAERFDIPVQSAATDSRYFDARGGKVALRRNPHRVDMLRSVEPPVVRDGRTTMLWRARISQFSVSEVRFVGNRLVVASERHRAVAAFDVDTAELILQMAFDAPDKVERGFVTTADTVVGLSGKMLVGYSLGDGTERFRFDLTGRVDDPRSIFETSGLIVVGGAEGLTCVLDPVTGQVVVQVAVSGFAPAGVYGGRLEADTLFLWGRGTTNRNSDFHLAAFRSDNGAPKWINTQLGRPKLLGQPTLSYPGVIPLFYAGADDSRVLFLDKAVGEQSANQAVPLSLQNATARPLGDVQFWPGRMVLGTEQGVELVTLPYEGFEHGSGWE
jgi:outer membrane protein assembly factor BamB